MLKTPAYVSCPTSIVNAPIDVVWILLTHPEGWGGFYNVRIVGIEPAGGAVVGQTVYAESGPGFLHLRIVFRFTEVDVVHHRLGLEVQFPFGITVREDMACVPMGERCRVSYNCGFGLPGGWRGALLLFLMRRRLDAGPADSLGRLQRAAESIQSRKSGEVAPGSS